MELETRPEDGDVVVSVVVIGAGLAGQPHAGEGAELTFHISFEPKVVVLEELGNASTFHFEDFENDCFATLRLVEGGVVIAGAEGLAILREDGDGPFGHLLRSVAGVNEEMWVWLTVSDNSLVLLDGTEQ